MSRSSHRNRRRFTPGGFESLETRSLLASAQAVLTPISFTDQFTSASTVEVGAQAVTNDQAVVRAKVSPSDLLALQGLLNYRGPGSEFISLVRSQVPNQQKIISEFLAGTRTELTVRGAVMKVPSYNSAYEGPRYDHLGVMLGGALLQNNGRTLQLGAVMRGPFDEPVTSQVVFGVNRGSGASLGSPFSSNPGVTPDAHVIITVGPNGSSVSGQIRDLKTGSMTPINPRSITLRGSILRVTINPRLLPSKGLPTNQYRFSLWTLNGTEAQQSGDSAVASFGPNAGMFLVGVQRGRR